MKRALVALALLSSVSCGGQAPSPVRLAMYDRPAQRPLGRSDFFPDRSASRPFVAGTVPRDCVGQALSLSPRRGQQRYDIYCAPCHGRDGNGNGVIVQHGFPHPPSFSTLVALSPADIVSTIANGKGAMYSYGDRVPEPDRWAIAAYIKSMQTEPRR